MVGRATWWLGLLLSLTGCLPRGGSEPCPVGACTPDDPDEACSAEQTDQVYRQRIAPLLRDEHPQSCSRCHLQGIDLTAFVRDTPCRSMACLVQQGMVDLDDPRASRILGLINRARGGPTAAAAEAEYQGFLAWIEQSSRCHASACGPFVDPCGPAPSADGGRRDGGRGDGGRGDGSPADAAARDAARTDAARTDGALAADARLDAGTSPDAWLPRGRPCDGPSLALRFQVEVMQWHNRCNSCHAETGVTAGIQGAPLWMVDGTDPEAARLTLRRLVAAGDLDAAHPEQSLLVTKPLSAALGGVDHGGGPKFVRADDPAYLDFLSFVRGWAACQPVPADGGVEASPDAGITPPPPDAGSPNEPSAAVQALCACVLATCHDLYHQIYGLDEVAARLGCWRQASRLPAETRVCRANACAGAPRVDEPDACARALGEAACLSP